MDRAMWKRLQNLQRLSKGLPPGERTLCACGGLLAFEQVPATAEASAKVILHHSEPFCARFLGLAQQAEFVTLAAATPAEVQRAISDARARHGG